MNVYEKNRGHYMGMKRLRSVQEKQIIQFSGPKDLSYGFPANNLEQMCFSLEAGFSESIICDKQIETRQIGGYRVFRSVE